MAIQDPNRFSAQQGALGQRANPQQRDPMQNRNQAGLPAGRAAQLQRWQNKSQAITGNQPPGKGQMMSLPGRMPLPRGGAVPGGSRYTFADDRGYAGGNMPQTDWQRGAVPPGLFSQPGQPGPPGVPWVTNRPPSSYRQVPPQLMSMYDERAQQQQGGLNPGQMDQMRQQMRPLASEGRGIQPDAPQQFLAPQAMQGPQGGGLPQAGGK